MKRSEAEKMIADYLKPIYGFALKRTANLQDAEDLSQDIVLRALRALVAKDDILDAGRFIWTVAHNALRNYYRDKETCIIGAAPVEAAEMLGDGTDLENELILREDIAKLQREIAYLSKIQRRIVIAYYYENKKQETIAEELALPVGTVKWHLFEAKKDLKRGMDMTREASELKFDPICFEGIGTNGTPGEKGNNVNFFRGALAQNIVYMVWKEAKTVAEIAQALGVSPVYVESEAEYLEEYGFLQKRGEKYLGMVNITEWTTEKFRRHEEIYARASALFANALYEKLMESDVWEDPELWGGKTGVLSMTKDVPKDKNFFLWALIPYIAAWSGEKDHAPTIRFEEAATLRPDGGHNICSAQVVARGAVRPSYYESYKKVWGPCHYGAEDLVLWQIDTEWSASRVSDIYGQEVRRALGLLRHEIDGTELTADEYAFLAERGYVTVLEENGDRKTAFGCVTIASEALRRKLITMGDEVRDAYYEEFDALKKAYIEDVDGNVPKHLRKMTAYCRQFLFTADDLFLFNCIKVLLENGKLHLPTEAQKKALSMVLYIKNI